MLSRAGFQEAAQPLLQVRSLTVGFHGRAGVKRVVRDVSFDVYRGEVLGVVGESGSGKSVTVTSIMGLDIDGSRSASGAILFDGQDVLQLSERQRDALCGRQIAMVFQNPMSAFNPVLTIGSQIAEMMRAHDRGLTRRAAREKAIALLSRVEISNPTMRYGQYPHQFSGGMRQRAMIAMAIANQPRLLICDEPTTALDVTVQAQIIEVLDSIRAEMHAGILFVTHDLGLLAQIAHRIIVMYAGRVVEQGPAGAVFAEPRHPYTAGLLASLPRLSSTAPRLTPIPGQPPDPSLDQPGCPFAPRCGLRQGRDLCDTTLPPLLDVAPGRASACHFPGEMAA